MEQSPVEQVVWTEWFFSKSIVRADVFMRRVVGVVLSGLMLVPTSVYAAGIFMGVGGQHPTVQSSTATGLSSDGSTVVGTMLDASTKFQAYRWTVTGNGDGRAWISPAWLQ